MLSLHYGELGPALKDDLFVLLGQVGRCYRWFGVAAIIAAAGTYRGRPRWLAWVALPVALCALLLAVVVQ